MSFHSTGQRTSLFAIQVIAAIAANELENFNRLMGPDEKPNYEEEDLAELFGHTDNMGQTVFHYLLIKSGSRRRRHMRASMCHRLLSLASNYPNALNHRDKDGNTILHLAIKFGFEKLAEQILNTDGVDIAVENDNHETPLQIAAQMGNEIIYKKLLKTHSSKNQKLTQRIGFSVDQIEKARLLHKEWLKKKQLTMGILGAFLGIACPVGSILAFTEMPLLGIIFSSLIPVVGPFIGLGAAVIIGTLLFWSTYSKTGLKYGAHGQALADIEAKNAQLDRLENELKIIDNQLAKELVKSNRARLLQDGAKILMQIDKIHSEFKQFEPRFEAKTIDWATPADRARAHLLAFGTFLCAFSGALGVLGGLANFLPLGIALTTVAAGIPVFGWCALGVALVVGLGVAWWAYKTKFKPTLKNYGEERQNLHEKQQQLAKRSQNLKDSELVIKMNKTLTFANTSSLKQTPSLKIVTFSSNNESLGTHRKSDIITHGASQKVSLDNLKNEKETEKPLLNLGG